MAKKMLHKLCTVVAGTHLLLAISSVVARAQVSQGVDPSAAARQDELPPRHWQVGFFAGGFVPFYSIHSPASRYGLSLDFLNAGLEGGVMISKPHGPRSLRGRAEATFEVVPFWRASYPRQSITIHYTNPTYGSGGVADGYIGPATRYGATVTPLSLRWNFTHETPARFMPWVQLGGGLLWTDHKFPRMGFSTSVINFTPQAGIGTSFFVRKRQSLDFTAKVVHISNAGLGDNNPGINATLQFSAGY